MKSSEKEMLKEMLGKLKLMRDLMHESHGVAGYHGNGDIMSWEEWEDLSPGALDELIDKVDFEVDL